MKKQIGMSIKQFITEHEKLINILRNGTEQERKAEADKQEKELKERKKQ
jgi:hypothetical protein